MTLIGGQSQRAGDGSTQIQANRDVIQHGISVQQMGEIMGAISQQVATQIAPLTELALKMVEQRLGDFHDRIHERFSRAENADASAFADPDFQAVLRGAAVSHARAGDAVLRDRLVEMVAQRSLTQTRSRQQLILNAAIETVSKLTESEIATLSVAFRAVHVHYGACDSLQKL